MSGRSAPYGIRSVEGGYKSISLSQVCEKQWERSSLRGGYYLLGETKAAVLLLALLKVFLDLLDRGFAPVQIVLVQLDVHHGRNLRTHKPSKVVWQLCEPFGNPRCGVPCGEIDLEAALVVDRTARLLLPVGVVGGHCSEWFDAGSKRSGSEGLFAVSLAFE